jgi:hypothetical protein
MVKASIAAQFAFIVLKGADLLSPDLIEKQRNRKQKTAFVCPACSRLFRL